MDRISNLSDRELLVLIHSEIIEVKERTTTLETMMDDHAGKVREVEITVYGDDKRKVKGILHHIDTMRITAPCCRACIFLEFTAGFIVGSIGILWGAFIAIREFLK